VWDAGHVEKRGGLKVVDIRPINEVYSEEELAVR